MKLSSGCIGTMFMLFLAVVLPTGCATFPQITGKLSSPPVAKASVQKIVVARVNNSELFMDDLVEMMNRLPSKKDGKPEQLEERRNRALDSLILLEIAYQQAKTRGFGVDVSTVDLAIGNLRDNVGGQREYTDYLNSHNLNEADLRAQVERSLTIERIYAREVVERVTTTEEDLRQEYEKRRRGFVRPEKVTVIDVFVPKKEGNDALKKAGELLALVRTNAGQDPWKLVLDGTFAVRRLAVSRDREKELYHAAKLLLPQGLSDTIETPEGVHLIKLETCDPEKQLSFDEARPEVEAQCKNVAREKRTREWEQELRQGARIEIIKQVLVSGQG